MRIVVLSDTHRDFTAAHEIVKRYLHQADAFIHLGDGEDEWEDICSLYPGHAFYYARGNCDFHSGAKPFGVLSCENGHKIFFTHGHLYHVKASLDGLERAARDNGCDIALFGHTHMADNFYDDGLYVMNPGSPSQPRGSKPGYGIVDITTAGVVCNNVVWHR